jgi:hypothetical protein
VTEDYTDVIDYSFNAKKPFGKLPLGRPTKRQEDSIKIYVTDVASVGSF